MSTTTIALPGDGSQRFDLRANLGGSIFGLEFIWNPRDQSWQMLLSDSSGALVCSKKVVVRFPLLTRCHHLPNCPNGEMMAIDTSGQDVDPGLTDFGTRVLLTFTDAADLP